MTEVARDLDQLSIDTIRTLSIDAVQKANSGHPGAPMGAAPMAYVLWTRHLRHAPTEPSWPNRDRFVLSAGHASMLLYSLLYLTGYGLTIEELQNFRRWGSRTPGHPERGMTPGVEVTTGPLGQGFANGVGMAIAQSHLAAEFNRPDNAILDHFVYAICSDGDLQEGIASEAASLAGHLRLGKLVYLYDDNHIQLDGPTSMAFNENVLERFDAYGWHTSRVEDGNDVAAIDAAITAAKADARPSLIAVRTHIGYGAPTKHDSSKSHGSALGEDEVRGAKEFYGWDPDRHFFVPDDALKHFRRAIPAGEELVAQWHEELVRYAAAYPTEAAELERRLAGRLPEDWADGLKTYATTDILATRQASQQAINALAGPLPELWRGRGSVRVDPYGRLRRRHVRIGNSGRAQYPLRCPRARHGRHRQRDLRVWRFHSVCGDVHDLQRLHARLRSSLRAQLPACDLRLDSRLRRRRRGWTHSRAGRACRILPGHPKPRPHPPGRCQ